MQILSSVTRRGLHPNVHQAQRGTNEAIYRSHLDEPKIQLNFEFPQSDLADLCLPQNISQQISKTSKRGLHLFSKDHKHIYIYHTYIYMYTYSDITYTFSVIEILYVIIYVYMCIHIYVL